MTYAEAIQFLYRLRWFGAKFGLDNTLKLAALAGNPHHQIRFIHVAGTNGKGSTCAMLESIYRQAGFRVGLFTSPHLLSFRERIQVDRQLIGEADVVRLVSEMHPWLERFPTDHQPTFFEIVTVMALRYFAQKKCDLVIWETGLGGRLDATNIVTPIASVITNIALDHQQWLGNSLAQIAAEKAGIIKPNIPVLTTTTEPDAFAVIERTAHEHNAPLTRVEQLSPFLGDASASALPLLGDHQKLNASLAVATVTALQQTIPVPPNAILKGLHSVEWLGRLQVVNRPLGRKYLLDAAHNPAGAAILTAALNSHFRSEKKTLILGILRDKDWRTMCAQLAPAAARILAVPVGSERTTTAAELLAACRESNPSAEVVQGASVQWALDETVNDPFVVITGSLYLIGEALERLGLMRGLGDSERALNEWGSVKHDAPTTPVP